MFLDLKILTGDHKSILVNEYSFVVLCGARRLTVDHFSHNGLQFSIETEPLRKVRVDDKNPNKDHAECDYKPADLVENSTEPKR
ncbi:MAG: hypothetical protein IH991_16595 [Planctomycetes bacterium]|nr:hypothetical protein [Planctomycetota bacterium]